MLERQFSLKVAHKGRETKRKLQQFTVSGWLIMNGGESSSGKEKCKTKITVNKKSQHNNQPVYA